MKKVLYLAVAALLGLAACSKPEVSPTEDPTTDPTENPTEDPTDDPVDDPVDDPASGVKVKATTVLNLTPNFIAISGFEQGAEYTAGSEVTLVITPGDIIGANFQSYHDEHIHIHVGDDVYMPEFIKDATPKIEMKIKVPEKDFELVACYSVQQQKSDSGYTMTLEADDNVRLYGVSQSVKYKYFDCYLLVTDAYTINSVEFKMGSGSWQDVASTTGCSFERTDVPNVYQVAIRPDYQDVTGDVVLRVSGTQHGRYKITWVNADAQHVDLSKFTFPTESIDGEQVAVEVWTLDPYYLAGASSSVDDLELTLYYNAYVVFTMPASDLTVTLDFKEKIPVSYAGGDGNISDAQVYDSPDIYYGVPTDKVIPGYPVYLFANAKSGYKPSTAKLSTGETFKFQIYGDGIDRYGYYAEVFVPTDATSASITAEAIAVHYVSGENIYFEAGKAYAEGEKVKFTVYVPSGKKVDGVTVKTASGTDVACDFDAPYGTFTMPAEDVVVTAAYSETSSGDTVHVIAYFDGDEYSVRSSTNYNWDFAEGFDVPNGTNIYLSVYDDYGEFFWVGIKIGETVTTYSANQDEDTGEYLFERSITASGDVVIKVGASESSVAF